MKIIPYTFLKGFIIISLCFINTAFLPDKQTTSQVNSPIIIAHRGGAMLGMENSLSCITKGIETDVDMIEIDVHLTADSQVVVCHDYTLDRTTNGTGKIGDYTLTQLRKYHLLHKDGTISDETIPTLEEVLILCKNRCPLLLEIKHRKGYNDGIESICVQLVKQFQMEQQVVFQSFSPESMSLINEIDEHLRTELLLGEHFPIEFINDSAFKNYLDTIFPHIASLNVHYSMANEEYINRVHNSGREIKIWTLDKPELTPQGVDGIITNCPDKFLIDYK